MTGGQLNYILALVLYGNGVTKGKVHFVILEECSLKSSVNRNFDALCNLCDHSSLLLARGYF